MKKGYLLLVLPLLFSFFVGCSKEEKDFTNNPYKEEDMWCIKEDEENLKVDTFFIAPTVKGGSGNLELNEKNKSIFLGATKMESGIYDTKTRFFAPYYHCANLNAYLEDNTEECLNTAYEDVKQAFEYYLYNYNNGNKIILAGFSQGADMCLRLLKDYVNNKTFYKRYVACYAIGWQVSDDYLKTNSRLKAATSEKDQKVIISFECEDPSIDHSYIIKEGEYTHSINPLTWTTDNEVADKSLNKGAKFFDTYGNLLAQYDNFTGCYIDPTRGTLKVTDVDKEVYSATVLGDEKGAYHLYDYQFFYENLKDNVIERSK